MIRYLLPFLLVTTLAVAKDNCIAKSSDTCYTSSCDEKYTHKKSSCSPCLRYLAEIRGAYFLPTDELFSDIYSGSGIYNIELSAKTCSDFYTWLSAGYFRKSGNSILETEGTSGIFQDLSGEGLNNSTTIQMIPLGLGIKYLFSETAVCREGEYQGSGFRPYLGIGLGVSWVDVNNESKYLVNISDWGVGGVFKGGAFWKLCECVYLDFFIDYTYMKLKPKRPAGSPYVKMQTGDLSGFSFGLGGGYSF